MEPLKFQVCCRCQKCNGDKYATLTSFQAEIIRQGQNGSTSAGLSPKKRHHNSRRGSLGRRNSQDLYGGFLDDEEDGEVEDDGEVRVPMNSLNLETYFVCGAYKVDKVTGSVKGTVAQGEKFFHYTDTERYPNFGSLLVLYRKFSWHMKTLEQNDNLTFAL